MSNRLPGGLFCRSEDWKRIAASMAMIAMTTSNSMSVKPYAAVSFESPFYSYYITISRNSSIVLNIRPQLSVITFH